MTSEFDQNLEKYVDVILKVGLNLQKGQRLLIEPYFGTPLFELTSLIKLIAKKAYQMGARLVEVLWSDPQLYLIRLQYAPRDSFEEFPIWRRDVSLDFTKKREAELSISATDPLLFKDQDQELLKIIIQSILKHNKPIGDLIKKNTTNWTGIKVPAVGWAKKVFPNVPKDERIAKFWDIIFDICRIKQKDPISAWENHIKELKARSNYLTKKQFSSLKMEGSGTDLTIGLPKGHIWLSAGFKSQNGINFVANIPTEEVFTIPHRDKTEGVVTMTKPLVYRGNLIEDIKLTFSKGKIVELNAGKGKKFLENITKTDEGASRLGEVALVPHSSPISQTGLLFYNIGIDENAANHIALGKGFNFNLKNGEDMSDEEFSAVGGNNSLVHIDCMVGSGEVHVDGIKEDGAAEPIMRNGEWAFNV